MKTSFCKSGLIATAAAAAMLAAVATGAGAQDYPTRPVNLIVPWPAGGSTDIAMRAIAEVAAKHLGQPITIDNKAGGGGTVGPATMAATAKPDGYTIAQLPISLGPGSRTVCRSTRPMPGSLEPASS